VSEGVHVFATFDPQSDGIGQRLVDEPLRDVVNRIDDLARACHQAVEERSGVTLERRPQITQHLGGQRLGDNLTHMGVAWRVVRQQDFRTQRVRVVPGPRLRGKRLPVRKTRGDIGVPRNQHRAIGQPHDR
jgi:hypothetical protein